MVVMVLWWRSNNTCYGVEVQESIYSSSCWCAQNSVSLWPAGDSKAYQQTRHLYYEQTTKGPLSSTLFLPLWLCTSSTWWQIQVGIFGRPESCFMLLVTCCWLAVTNLDSFFGHLMTSTCSCYCTAKYKSLRNDNCITASVLVVNIFTFFVLWLHWKGLGYLHNQLHHVGLYVQLNMNNSNYLKNNSDEVNYAGIYSVSTKKLEGHSVERITSDKGRYPTAQLICVFVVLDLDLWPWASTAYSALPCRRSDLCTKFRHNLP